LGKITERLKWEYPNVSVATYSPPFKSEFSEEDNARMVSKINDFKPNIVFVGMTCPKQEKWSVRHRDELDCNLMISIGAVFDWYAGTEKAIHPIWFTLRMGWLLRIIRRPEIFQRNMGNQMTFFWHLLLVTLKLKRQPA
jgi:N-acetylglucosaminyldiphosphoundecaprenol N-acetyl-beta-D-mannosaminyltransferase